MKQATGARITILEDDTNLTKITKITNLTKIKNQGSDRHKSNKCLTRTTDKGRDTHKYKKLTKITYVLKK